MNTSPAIGVELFDLDLPDFGLPTQQPSVGADTYRKRLARLGERAEADNLDVVVVYGDREHFANLTYLTGYDPRFEESLLLLNVRARTSGKPILVVGNEGLGYVNISPVRSDFEIAHCPTLSLLDQPRSQGRWLGELLDAAGVREGRKVGTIGWKSFTRAELDSPEHCVELPSFLVDAVREKVGRRELVVNRTALLMDSNGGLRSINEVDQLACFEFAAAHASQAVRNVLFNMTPGMTELEACARMGLNGLPLSCHVMLSAGERAAMGLPSPSSRRIRLGDPITTACGLWGGLTCRAGFVVASARELPPGIADYVEKLVAPYFAAIAAWYERIGIGVRGGELYRAIHERIGAPFFGVGLNPGHLLHLDEWLSSPVSRDSETALRSGMALQVDVIPATGTPYFTTNIEDGIALADAELRSAFSRDYPEAWERIQRRRRFMETALGIRLKPEVLPFSNLPAVLPPFWLAPQRALRVVS
jgi:Xaa-Pro aminopeptidase